MIRLLHNARRAWSDDRGVSEAIGVVFLAFPVIAFVGLLAWAGKASESVVRMDHAAEASAQAAALQRSAGNARSAATTVANNSLGTVCAGGPVVSVDTSTFVPGGFVSVTISCTIGTTDGFSDTVTASSSAVIDRYRQP